MLFFSFMDNKMKRTRRMPISNIVLSTLAVGGFLALATVAPNAVQMLKLFGYGKRKQNPNHQVNRTFVYLNGCGYIALVKKDGRTFVRLTEKGEKRLRQYQKKEKLFGKPNRWDGKWRVVIFDIKEKKRGTRDKLRAELQNIGFVRLQNSVWVFPYDCEEMLIMLKADMHIGKDILYLVSERVENDAHLREIFDLY